jgi:RNA polymerase sigma-70 factor (ECF subfamily)
LLLTKQEKLVFDVEFLAGLREREPVTCTRFVFFFTPLIEAKLRHEFSNFAAIEDVRNDTFIRVITLVDRDQVRDPQHFGSFVLGVCSKVAQEHRRNAWRTEPLDCDPVAHSRSGHALEGWLQDEELKKIVGRELSKLSEEDRSLITEGLLKERNRREMAEDLGMTPGGLNVRICRALERFRARVLRAVGGKR